MMINYLIIFQALISSLFGGMFDPFYLPLFLIINCLCILFLTVKSKLPLFFYPLTLIFIFLGILSAWFQPVPEGLAKTTTSQLGVSLESVFLAANALLWFGWVLGNPQGEKKRIGIFRTYGWVVAGVGMVALICRVQRWPFPFTSPQAYGIFPNTNHMSNWLAIAAILLVGTVYADIRRKNFAPAIFSFLGILAALTCLAANSSRGGLAVFFLGLVLWAVGLATGGPDRRIGILLLAGAALAATVLLFQGARPLERMKKPWMGSATATIPSGSQETEETETLDFRLLLQRDALDLSADLPWLGTGPGNFRYLFPPYRHRTFSNQSTAIHPESDWLWLVCEFGWPAAILLFGGAFALGRAAGPGRNREGWITRSAGGAAVIAFALHSFVDVPGHRIGTVWPILLVAGLVCARKKEEEDQAARPWEVFFFRAGGILLLAGSLAWFWGVAGNRSWPATVAAERAKAAVGTAWKQGDAETALQAAEQGIQAAPYDQVLRFLHGKALLFFEDTEAEAAEEFAIQSRLEPFLLSVPLDQAAAWTEILPDRPELALPAYREALRRALEYQARDGGPERVLDHILRLSGKSPALRPHILPMIENQSRLISLYLAGLPPQEFHPAVAALLASHPELNDWSEESLARLFAAWARRGETESLQSLLEKNPSWNKASWPVLAQLRAKTGKSREALQLVQEHLAAPSLPENPCPAPQAESRWYRSPRDYGAAFMLAETRRKNGDLTGARVVLEKITERPEAPPYFWWLRSRVEAEEGRDAAAWDSMRKYLEQTAPGWPRI